MGFNLLSIMRPVCEMFPRVRKSCVPVTLAEKMIYTSIGLFIYLVCSQIPLYGIERGHADPFHWTRFILASSKGTLIDLGIGPIITAGWMLSFFSTIGLVQVKSARDEQLLEGFENTIALILGFGEVVGNIWYGSYGSNLGWTSIILIILQLMAATFIVILIDDMLGNGYGLGSGISLFILANTCENIFWALFSPVTFSTAAGTEFEGVFVCLVQLWLTKESKLEAISHAFFRKGAGANLMSVVGTVAIFCVLIYLQGFRKRIRLINQRFPGYQEVFSIKLFYTNSMSVILLTIIISFFNDLSKVLYSRFGEDSYLIYMLGSWKDGEPIAGLAWYITSPGTFTEALSHPVRFLTSTTFVCGLSAFFSLFWIEITQRTASHIAIEYRKQEMTLPNYKEESVYKKLNRDIPTAAMLGGICIGLLSIIGDMFNMLDSTSGILISVLILYRYSSSVEAASLKSESDYS